MLGNKYGTHRVLYPQGVLPQPAEKVDNNPEIFDNEILIDVEIINITSTAFRRIKRLAAGDVQKMADEVIRIVEEKGKFQCPETGSGGMLIGRVAQIGSALQGKVDLAVGEQLATMVSLSLTPLKIEKIYRINPDTDQVFAKGTAILFESGIWAKIPEDLGEALSVAVMDVAGAPAWTAKLVKPKDTAIVIGLGKAGLLCLHEARKKAGAQGTVIALEYSEKQCEIVRELGLADYVLCQDAADPIAVMEKIKEITFGEMADFVVNTVNLPNTEMSSILSCKDHATILFFSMATSFTKAALDCEGVGKIVNMIIGTGYLEGHAELTYQILRENSKLKEYFQKVYSG